MTRAARRRARQQMPQSEHAVPDAAPVDLVSQANRIAREARRQGFDCIVELGDERNRYKPRLSIEIWDKAEGKTA